MYSFELGQSVRIRAGGTDPGGVGVVTGREQREDNRGTAVLYRVKITDHPIQDRVAAAKSRENNGFWYKSDLVGVEGLV